MAVQSDRVIGERGLESTPRGLRLELRLPWYRSLPLSTIEIGEVKIDGRALSIGEMFFELEGQRYRVDDLPDQIAHVWYVLDSAWLWLPPQPDAPYYDVAVTLCLYPPYIHGLKRPTRENRTLTARAGEQPWPA